MIWGTTWLVRERARSRRKRKERTWRKRFAWFPVELSDGRSIWMEWHWYRKKGRIVSRYLLSETKPDGSGPYE